MGLAQKLESVIAKHDELQDLLATQTDMDRQEYVRLSKEFAEIAEIVRVVECYRDTEAEIQDLESIFNDSNSDNEVKALAEEEYQNLRKKLPYIEREMQILL